MNAKYNTFTVEDLAQSLGRSTIRRKKRQSVTNFNLLTLFSFVYVYAEYWLTSEARNTK